MRILHLVNDAQTGGAQTLIEALGREADERDQIHLLVLMGRGSLSTRLEEVATSVSYVGMKQRDVFPARAVRAMNRLVKRHHIELVHSHLMQSDLISLLSPLKIPRVSTVHTSGAHESRAISGLVGKVVARLSGRFNAVVACSASAQRYAQRNNYRSQSSIILNGTQLDGWSVENGVSSQNFVHLARWHEMKDHSNLFQALRIVRESFPAAALHCAGLNVDADNPAITELINSAGVDDAVTLHGSVQSVKPLFDTSRGLVISSSHGEALPMAGIEALSSGLPVVTTDVGDCAELAIGNDYLVAPRQPEELAEAMLKLIQLDPARYRAARAQARGRAEQRFDERVTAQKYRKLYQQLLAA
ncbi:glycosyltransferase [Psychromicrobium lacuslunae]|uniref:Glycosyltransferase subfamily 4-like N-terminal domain-containing protein n=1 Tax=Psychromicrobium lacuslunae TaxID=1618207 RepID=A0A0D4C205_9MICC|nr:glycosyltransferase [Psychromicrobium lacuslunae]AJT42564.1 hypothetical protein UM93_15670 [Psychromicrobium lacuslunae]